MNDIEIWTPINNNEYYEISSIGNVRSLDQSFFSKNYSIYIKKGKEIKKHLDKDGYVNCSIVFEKLKSKTVKVHRLVAESFLPNKLNKPQVNHKNGIKSDNRVENLEWCTASENQIHSVLNNLRGQNNKINKNGRI